MKELKEAYNASQKSVAVPEEKTKSTDDSLSPSAVGFYSKISDSEQPALTLTPKQIGTVLTEAREDNVADLTRAHLPKANLSGQDLSNFILAEADLSEANLFRANLSEANLSGANLSGNSSSPASEPQGSIKVGKVTGVFHPAPEEVEATPAPSDLTPSESPATPEEEVLARQLMSQMMGSPTLEGKIPGVNLQEANLTGANLSDANLSDADLSNSTLDRTNLKAANLRGANLAEVEGNIVNLKQADLTGANLMAADLRQVDADGANLTNTNLLDAQLREWKTDRETNFSGVRATEARHSSNEQLGTFIRGALNEALKRQDVIEVADILNKLPLDLWNELKERPSTQKRNKSNPNTNTGEVKENVNKPKHYTQKGKPKGYTEWLPEALEKYNRQITLKNIDPLGDLKELSKSVPFSPPKPPTDEETNLLVQVRAALNGGFLSIESPDKKPSFEEISSLEKSFILKPVINKKKKD